MDTSLIAKWVQEELSSICPQSYSDWNYSTEVIYPYLTYQMSHRQDEYGRLVTTVEMDLFNYGRSRKPLMDLETKILNHFNNRVVMSDGFLIRSRNGYSVDIPTGNETIKRKNMTIELVVDWRGDK